MADFSLNLDPKLIGTDAYRDLLIINGDLVLTSDADPRGASPVVQQLTQRLRFIAGEWFMNVGLGIPYYQQLLGRRGSISAFEAVLQNTVLNTPGITSLLSWSTQYDRAKRLLQVSFQAESTSGLINYNANLDPRAGDNT